MVHEQYSGQENDINKSNTKSPVIKVDFSGYNPLSLNQPVQVSPKRKLPFDLADYDNILGNSESSSDDDDVKMN